MRSGRLTPLDLNRKTFSTGLRGYDQEEVREFLKLVSEEMEALIVENNRQSSDNARLSEGLKDYSEKERILRDTLYTAQKVSEDTRRNAEKEAEVTVKQAEIKADEILRAAQLRAHKVESQIVDLKMERERLLLSLQDLLNRVQSMVSLIEESDKGGQVRTMVPRGNAGGA